MGDEIGGFDRARILSPVVTRDDWPPQRAVAGSDPQLVAAQVAERYPL